MFQLKTKYKPMIYLIFIILTNLSSADLTDDQSTRTGRHHLIEAKSFEIYTSYDILYLEYSPDYDAYELHSEVIGQLTDRMDLDEILTRVERLSPLYPEEYWDNL